jgi:hypothetical protein
MLAAAGRVWSAAKVSLDATGEFVKVNACCVRLLAKRNAAVRKQSPMTERMIRLLMLVSATERRHGSAEAPGKAGNPCTSVVNLNLLYTPALALTLDGNTAEHFRLWACLMPRCESLPFG